MRSKTYKVQIKGLDERSQEEMSKLGLKIIEWYQKHHWYNDVQVKRERYHDNRLEITISYQHGGEWPYREVSIDITNMEVSKRKADESAKRSLLNEDELDLFGQLGFELEENYQATYPELDINRWF